MKINLRTVLVIQYVILVLCIYNQIQNPKVFDVTKVTTISTASFILLVSVVMGLFLNSKKFQQMKAMREAKIAQEGKSNAEVAPAVKPHKILPLILNLACDTVMLAVIYTERFSELRVLFYLIIGLMLSSFYMRNLIRKQNKR